MEKYFEKLKQQQRLERHSVSSTSSGFSFSLRREPLDVDAILSQLLKFKTSKFDREINLKEEDIDRLCSNTKELILSQPMFLELDAPVHILGDIHGQYYDLLKWFKLVGYPPENNFLFLGDYVDRGSLGVEVMCLLMCYKIKYPENFFFLRGNHESAALNMVYGFYYECKRRYSFKLWKTFTDLFNCLPIAALVEGRIFCVHGGLSPKLFNFNQIRELRRPTVIPEEGLLCDLLWSDPDPQVEQWGENDRGVSFSFGAAVVKEFVKEHNLDVICRAHQVVEDGFSFFANRRLVTLFSAPNYCGEFDNAGGMMVVDETLLCSFKILKPKNVKTRRNTAESIGKFGGLPTIQLKPSPDSAVNLHNDGGSTSKEKKIPATSKKEKRERETERKGSIVSGSSSTSNSSTTSTQQTEEKDKKEKKESILKKK